MFKTPNKGRPSPTPWRRMMGTAAMWSIVINNFCFHYAFYVCMNWLPTYFNRFAHPVLYIVGSISLHLCGPLP